MFQPSVRNTSCDPRISHFQRTTWFLYVHQIDMTRNMEVKEKSSQVCIMTWKEYLNSHKHNNNGF